MKIKILASILYLIRKTNVYLFFVFVCLQSLFLSAQNYPTRQFTMRDGLPGMSIQSIYKDSRGLMWIGTTSGLCSYDGKSFRIYQPSEGMTANQIWAIAEDNNGNMWFGSYGEGLFKYDGIHFIRFTQKNGLANDRIRVLCFSKNFNCLIAGCEGGVSTIRGDSITSSPHEVFSKENGSPVTGLTDAGKFIYITTFGQNNPIRYYPNENRFVNANNNDLHYPVNSFSVFITSKGDTVFSYGHSGVAIYKKDAIIQDESMGQVFGIAEDKRGDLWFASWSYPNRKMIEGVFRFDGKSFKNYKTAFGITDKEIWTVFYDPEQDILWVGTRNEGLFKIPFSGIELYPSKYFNLDKNFINDLYLDSKDNLWISGSKELIRMTHNNEFSVFDKKPFVTAFRIFWNQNNDKTFFHSDPAWEKAMNQNTISLEKFVNQYEFNFVRAIENSDNSMIISNLFGVFDFNTETKKNVYIGPQGNHGDIAIFGLDTIMATGWGGTELQANFRKNPPKEIANSFFYFNKKLEPKDGNRIAKHNNRFWFVSWTSGLWMSEGMHLTNFNITDSTISNSLNDICFDEKGNVIFGSNSGEICIAAYNDNKLKINYRINSENGLQGNSVSWLVADQRGKLWVGTNLGLNCIDLDSLYINGKYVIRFMDEEEGFAGQSAKKAVMDSLGNLWIGAEDQLMRLDSKSLFPVNNTSQKIILHSLEINHTLVDSLLRNEFSTWSSSTFENKKLKHSENNLVFYFDILNYSNPKKDRFRYILHGFDTEWNDWSSGRKAVYTNLPSGKYSLRIESYNLHTLNHAEPFIIEFTIRHPWWGLWYLQVLAVVLFVSAVFFITRKYTEAKRKKQQQNSEIEKTIVELEMQAMQAQMNPHFIFNCINGIQYYVLANKMDEVLGYLSDFSKVVRGSLENASLRMVSLEQSTQFLKSYLRLELMRFSDKFDYTIKFINIENTDIVMLPPMLIQPFAENAIRHGFMHLKKKGNLTIEFELIGSDILKCTLTDNGIGRNKARRKKDPVESNERLHSATITEKRINLFNTPGFPAKYKIVYTDLEENKNSTGLKVELYLPTELRKGQ